MSIAVHDWTFSVRRDVNETSPALDAAQADAAPRSNDIERILDISSSWDGLQAAYAFEWPLHLIMCRDSFVSYNRLFSLLWATTRTQVELELAWPILMDGKYRSLPPRDNVWLRPLRSLHGRMLFYVKNIQIYLQVDVVETAHRILVDEVKSKRDFDSVRRAHSAHLAQMIKKSHVGVRPLMDGLHRLLRLCRHLAVLVTSYTDAISDIPHSEVRGKIHSMCGTRRAPLSEPSCPRVALRRLLFCRSASTVMPRISF